MLQSTSGAAGEAASDPWPFAGPVVVAVSGGLDSMVLLNRLWEKARAEGGRRLVVAHFNHRLRGRAARADENLVRRAAHRLGLQCVVGSGDVRGEARRRGISLEMAARELRHAFLARAARQSGARVVALAHHADDQVELFFLRLLRGTGGEGIGGMKTLSPSPADARVQLWRPLLHWTRAELAAFAEERNLAFRTDASNASPVHFRNRVRHELLPLLHTWQPAIAATVARLMNITTAEAELAATLAERWLAARRRTAWLRLPLAVQRHVLCRQLLRLGIVPGFDLVEALRQRAGKRITAPGGYWLVRDARGEVRREAERVPAFGNGERSMRLPRTGGRWRVAQFAGGTLRWRVIRRPDQFQPGGNGEGAEFFDADRIGARFALRHWRPGDRFRPIGFGAAVKLQDWFTNRKVPAAERRRRALGVTAEGAIFWVEGERIGDVAKVTARTRRLLEWRWSRPG
ncbi:MAG: tRNA lysidine(34) synthetase TilS [Limisphaerales bacterium]